MGALRGKHMRYLLAAAAAVSLTAGGSAVAQPEAAAPPPKAERTTQQIEAAKAAFTEGEAIIKAAKAEDVFVNESQAGSGAIELRHKASGFKCIMNPGSGSKVVVFENGLPRGDDVACDTQTFSDSRTIYFTRSSHSTAQELAGAVTALKTLHPKIKTAAHPSEGKLMGRPLPPQTPRPGVAVFANGRQGERVDVGVVDGWAVKFRYTTPSVEIASGELLDIFWLITAVSRTAP